MPAANGIRVLELVIALRAVLGLDPDDPPPATAVLPPMPLDLVVTAVDLHAWISWSVGCLPLFAGGWPTAEYAREQLHRLHVSATMMRAEGKISRAAVLLKTSRARLRATLKNLGFYPWPPDREDGSEEGGPIADGFVQAPTTSASPVVEVAAFLRFLVGLLPANDESRPTPRAVDAEVWIAWVLAGLHACALPRRTESENAGKANGRRPWMPPVGVLVAEARRVATVIAMRRYGGNLTHASKALGVERQALRRALRRFGMYPWTP